MQHWRFIPHSRGAESGGATPSTDNDVFVSYSRKDKAFVVAIEKALESYMPPRDLKVPQRHLVVFRDESDFTGGEYHTSLARHLQASSKIIVLCSPYARQSEYVNDEIRRFAGLRGAECMIPVLVSGLPNNEAKHEQDKAFPEALMADGGHADAAGDQLSRL